MIFAFKSGDKEIKDVEIEDAHDLDSCPIMKN